LTNLINHVQYALNENLYPVVYVSLAGFVIAA